MNTSTIAQKYPRVYTSPAFVCCKCGHTLPFDVYKQSYLDAWQEAGCQLCGGVYHYTSVAERYALLGTFWCETVQCYTMTTDCPTPMCWAARCPLAEAMATKVAEDILMAEAAEDMAAWGETAFGCREEEVA